MALKRAKEAKAKRKPKLTQDQALREFFRWAMTEGPWDGCDLDGGDVQEKACKLGLIIKTKYDPAKHGEPPAAFDFCDIEPGDDWYVIAPGI